ncbi:MAG: hypothetical protein O3A63_12310 [Proteobacteria bacterium]|nr:hypothetical protein [Pseudomonadota bacterium]
MKNLVTSTVQQSIEQRAREELLKRLEKPAEKPAPSTTDPAQPASAELEGVTTSPAGETAPEPAPAPEQKQKSESSSDVLKRGLKDLLKTPAPAPVPS